MNDDANAIENQVMLAEQSVLGGLMLSPHVAREVTRLVTSSDFYSPRHQLIFEAIERLRHAEAPTDTVAVVDELIRHGSIDRAGGADYVHTLTSVTPTASNAGYYAALVAAASVGRGVTAVAMRAQDGVIRGEDSAIVLARAIDELHGIRDRHTSARAARSLGEVLDVPAEADVYDWVIPGVLERMDRLILTGGEGGGKSTLLRQLAVMAAAGVHPFTHQHVQPARVLVVDGENSEKQWRRAVGSVALNARVHGVADPRENLFVDFVSRINITRANDLGNVHRMLDDCRPDLVLIGPLYRLAPSIKNDEEALPVLEALDTIRDRGVAMMLEAHAPHADAKTGQRDLRPIGSSALLRWPEFGLGIAKPIKPGEPFQLVKWRGDRDARNWPTQLHSQREVYGQRWPWEPSAAYYSSVPQGALPAGSTPDDPTLI